MDLNSVKVISRFTSNAYILVFDQFPEAGNVQVALESQIRGSSEAGQQPPEKMVAVQKLEDEDDFPELPSHGYIPTGEELNYLRATFESRKK